MSQDRIKIVDNNKDLKPGQIYIHEVAQLPDSSVLEIELSDTLDKFSNRDELMGTILSKLRYNGFISIKGLDLVDLAGCVYLGKIDPIKAGKIIYERKSADTLENVVHNLLNGRMKIIHKRVSEMAYFVKAQRINPNG